MKRLRAIRKREQETDWWSNSLTGLKERHWGETPQIPDLRLRQPAEAPQETHPPLLPCEQVIGGDQKADRAPATLNPLSSPLLPLTTMVMNWGTGGNGKKSLLGLTGVAGAPAP